MKIHYKICIGLCLVGGLYLVKIEYIDVSKFIHFKNEINVGMKESEIIEKFNNFGYSYKIVQLDQSSIILTILPRRFTYEKLLITFDANSNVVKVVK